MREIVKNCECFFNFINNIQGGKSRRHVLEQSVEDIREYLNAQHCVLLLFDPMERCLVSRVAQNINTVRIPLDPKNLPSYCFNTGKTVCVNDVSDSKELSAINPNLRLSDHLERAYGYTTRCVLLTPVIARGRKVGVFMALNTPGGFINFQVEGAIEFAPLLGLSVEIVLLDEALQEVKSRDELPFISYLYQTRHYLSNNHLLHIFQLLLLWL